MVKNAWQQSLLALGLLLGGYSYAAAQTQDMDPEVAHLYKNANAAVDRKDYDNAVMMFTQAIQLDPNNVALRRDLAYTFYLQQKYIEAEKIIEPVAKSSLSDEPTYQLASAIEVALGHTGRAEKYVSDGLKKFPNSGMLYNSRGNLQGQNVKKALEYYNKGIEVAPAYPGNYFNAAKLYLNTEDVVWAVIYAETFINLETSTARTAEMKQLLMKAYTAYFSAKKAGDLPDFDDISKNRKKADFMTAYKNAMQSGAGVLANGINVETLAMLRMRFLIYWEKNYAAYYPFSLADYNKDILKSGFYEAYHEWLFGAADNSTDFGIWVKQNNSLFSGFEKWHEQNPYLPGGNDPRPR